MNATELKFKLNIERIGNTLELDRFRIHEALENGKTTLISPRFFNKGVYRVRNSDNGNLENIAVNIDKIGAVTLESLIEELGEDCVDKNLWKGVPDGEPIFFYSLKLENNLVT